MIFYIFFYSLTLLTHDSFYISRSVHVTNSFSVQYWLFQLQIFLFVLVIVAAAADVANRLFIAMNYNELREGQRQTSQNDHKHRNIFYINFLNFEANLSRSPNSFSASRNIYWCYLLWLQL